MRTPDQIEVQRLQHLLESASKSKNAAAREFNEEQVASSAGRKEYFEKLALGSGAAIAAIVSFVGTHSGRLQPPWQLRCALISLVVALIAAMFRNFRYPYYLLAVRKKSWMVAMLEEQGCKRAYFLANPNTVDTNTGQLIDGAKWAQESEESSAKTRDAIEETGRAERRFFLQWNAAEYLCVFAIVVAMTALVLLVIKNF
jgi:hypothetical protein